MYGEKIQEVTKTKYLGHIITNDLANDADIDRQVKKLYAQDNSIGKDRMLSSLVMSTQLRLLMTCIP